MKTRLNLFFLILWPVCGWSSSLASPALAVVTENSPPYNFINESGAVDGLSTLMVREILKGAGLPANIQLYPWARSLSLAQTQANTLIYSIARTQAREHKFIWIGELASHSYWFYQRRSNAPVPDNLTQLKAAGQVCVVKRDVAEDYILAAGFKLGRDYITASSRTDCVKMTATGAVQYFISSPENHTWDLKFSKLPEGQFTPTIMVPHSDQAPLYLAASLNSHPAWVQRLQKTYLELQGTGRLGQIRQSFMKQLTANLAP